MFPRTKRESKASDATMYADVEEDELEEREHAMREALADARTASDREARRYSATVKVR